MRAALFDMPPIASPEATADSPGEFFEIVASSGGGDVGLLDDGEHRPVPVPRAQLAEHAYGPGIHLLAHPAPAGCCWRWTLPAADGTGGGVTLERRPSSAN